MIPKIIHYCWFGRGEMPALEKRCILSWKKKLPGYEIKEWNEDNFDVGAHVFTKEAYELRKFAFVADYVRLWALANEGGIYMDTDVEVLDSLDDLLRHPAFVGMESSSLVSTGIMGSEKGGAWVRKQFGLYVHRHFLKEGRTPNLTPNTKIITDSMVAEGFVLNNEIQDFKGEVVVYPQDWFSPKNFLTGVVCLTSNSRTIHHNAGSWSSPLVKMKKKILRPIRRFFPNAFTIVKNFYHHLSGEKNEK